MRRTRASATATALAAGLLLAGCGGGAAEETPPPGEAAEVQSPAAPEAPADGTAPSDVDCYIHLFDDEDFDETDDNFKLTEPGEYENLSDLPGADKDWTDEADSFKVGASAKVTIYSEENFRGESQDLEPGTEVADADNEPVSLEMSCD